MTVTNERRTSPADQGLRAGRLAAYAAAVTLGLGTFALLIESWVFVATAAVTAMATSVIVTRQTSPVSYRPRRLEWVLGLLGASGIGSICSVLGIFLHIIVYAISSGLGWALEGHAFAGADRDWPALISAAVLIFFVVAMAASDAPVFLRKLSMPASDPTSPYSALAQDPQRLRRKLRWTAVALVAAMLLALYVLLDSPARYSWLYLPFSFFWLTVTLEFWEMKSSNSRRVRGEPLVKKIGLLLEAAGYQVVIYPTTGNADAASLISLLDFMAVRPDRILAGKIRQDIDWNPLNREFMSLRPAAATLEDELSKTREVEIEVEPVLILVGGQPRNTEWENAPGYRMIIAPAEAELDEMLADQDVERRARKARLLCDGGPSSIRDAFLAKARESWQ